MEWFAATARSLFATTPRLNVTLDSQSGESLVVDENADTHARKRRRSKSSRWPAPGDSAMVLRERPVNEADDDMYAPPASVLNRGNRHLTEQEAAQFVRVALFAKRDRVLSMRDLCARWRLSPSQGYKLLDRYKEQGHVRRAYTSGRPKVITPRLGKILVSICDEKEGRLTFSELTATLNEREGMSICTETVRLYCKENKWRQSRDQYVPILTDKHVATRKKWATENLHNTWSDEQAGVGWVDIDEKQFHARTLYQSRLRPPGCDYGRTPTKHKGYIPKIMVLSALACPMPAFNFNGKIGNWRFTEKVKAKRDSKNRPKGTWEDKDVNISSHRFVVKMINEVFPTIREKMHFCTKVVVQFDNASSHGTANANILALLNAHGAKQRVNKVTGEGYYPKIVVRPQPAQSPETNVLDCGFFFSLAKRISKVERDEFGHDDLNRLWQTLQMKYDAYTAADVARFWHTKTAMVREIFAHEGRNGFPLPHKVAWRETQSEDEIQYVEIDV